jgi:esterase/lipase superfamily enzyme
MKRHITLGSLCLLSLFITSCSRKVVHAPNPVAKAPLESPQERQIRELREQMLLQQQQLDALRNDTRGAQAAAAAAQAQASQAQAAAAQAQEHIAQSQLAPPPPPEPMTTKPVKVKVFYATDRKPSAQRQIGANFGPDEEPSESMSYGSVLVSIPPNHVRGHIESVSLLRFEISEDVNKHVVIQKVSAENKATFFSDLRSDVDLHSQEALIFIHGYNVTFDDAAKRTAQLAFDLKLRGVPILYSWPSRGTLLGYSADEDSISWTTSHLMQFLQDVHDNSGAKVVHVIAHSMGNRAFLSALEILEGEKSTVHFGQVVLAAPDVASSLFKQQIPIVQSMADHITLYASSKDEALAASHRVNYYARAGQSGTKNLTIVPPVETLDATSISHGFLGHSYFGENTLVLDDMVFLINDGKLAAERARLYQHLKQSTLNASIYWTFASP